MEERVSAPGSGVPAASRSVDRVGTLLVVLSGATFGANPIFAKLSYHAGASVGTFLTVRFTLAAALFWIFLRPRLARADLLPGLGLGLAYCGQAGFFFTAVSMQDANVTGVMQAVTPALVATGAVALGREPARRRIFGGVAAAAVGMALVALGGGTTVGHVRPLALALSLASAVWYSGYLLIGDRIVGRIDPLPLATLIATGGGVGFALGSLAIGQLHVGFHAVGWLWLFASAVVSTVIAVTAVMAGMQRIGPSLTGILSTSEPVATVILAFLVFGERLTVLQAAGAALVLGAVIAVQLPSRRPLDVLSLYASRDP
jgi:drug/metabolite transporter (DMT)-like permease